MLKVQTTVNFAVATPIFSPSPSLWRSDFGGVSTSDTFRSVAGEWLSKNEREGRAPVTLGKMRWLIELADPFLGERPIDEVSPPEVLAALRELESRGLYESARRMRSVISRVFRYAIATSRADKDPSNDLRGALITPKVMHRAAMTTPAEAGALLRAFRSYPGRKATAVALLLSAHLFVRPGELRKAEWSEIESEKRIWTISAAKTKMRREHRVPLSRQAISLFNLLRAPDGASKFVFPSSSNPERCMSENTVNLALRRLGFGPDQMTAHGFRAMAASLLNEMGIWNPDAIERQLGHQDGNAVRRAYCRAEFWDERVRMMQHWSDHLDRLAADGMALPD